MQNEMYPVEPNLIAEAYRNHSNLLISRRIEKHFDFIDISEDGWFLLGTSNLSGRIWSGSVWVFKKYDEIPDIEKSIAGTELESSVASGLWLDNTTMVIGCDSGNLRQLSVHSVVNKKSYFSTDADVSEHDDSIVSINLMKNKTKIVTGSMDMNIKVWDAETFLSDKSYCPAHGHMVTSVSSQIESNDTFISTSLDGTSLIWDIRLEKPASLLLKNECGFTASCWLDENYVSIGSNNGSVILIDLRTKSEVDRNSCSNRPIFRFRFNRQFNLLAVCADDPTVRVFNCKEKSLLNVYEQEQHKDFVRGLAWEPSSNVLYSCGWDSKVVCHEIIETENEDNKISSKNENKEEA